LKTRQRQISVQAAVVPIAGCAASTQPTSASSTQDDVNQLVPFKYIVAWESTLPRVQHDAARSEHVARHRDLERSNGLTDDERRIIKRNWASSSCRFAGCQQHRVGHLPPHHAPESASSCAQAFEEAIHTILSYIVESLA